MPRAVYVVEMRVLSGEWLPYSISPGGSHFNARENLKKARLEAREGWLSNESVRTIERKFRIRRYLPG